MKNLVVIILVFMGFAAYAQPSNSGNYLIQSAKWRFKYPIWADSGTYNKNIQKMSNQNRVLVADSVTGKTGYKFITSGSTDTTSLSNRINLRVKYTDTSSMLSKYLRSADTLHMTYTSPLIRQGNNLSAPSVLTGLTAGNGIITSGSTIYADTTKIASLHGNSWQNGMYLGSSNNRSLVFRTNGVQAMTLDSNQRLGLGVREPSYKLDVLSTSNNAVRIKGNAGGGFIMGSLDANWGGFWSSGVTPSLGNYAVLVHPTTGVAFNAPPSTGNVQFNIDDITKLRIHPTGNVSVGNATSVSQLSVTVAPKASPNYGLFSLSNTTTSFNGSTSGYFVGAPAGTYIAVNSVGSVAYDFLQFSKNGGAVFRVDSTGKTNYAATVTAGGTTGAQTINKPSGSVNFAAAASTLVVTNSLVSTSSLVFVTVYGTDATALSARVTLASGSFTITLNAAATAETKVGFFVIN